MKKLRKSEIHLKVLAFLDELGENDADFILSDKDATELTTIIDEVTPLSVRNVHLNAPNYLLDGEKYTVGQNGSSEVSSGLYAISDTLKVTIGLPKDFLRLVSVKMSSWMAPVTGAITEDMPEYRMQANEYMRGTASKPVCAYVRLGEDLSGLELYSAEDKDKDSVQYLYILYEPSWGRDGSVSTTEDSIEMCSRLEDSIIAQITGQTLLALGENQRAETFLTLSNNYLQ